MGTEDYVIGTCDGTRAAINVCLGFEPRSVTVLNIEDNGAKAPRIEWQEGMELVAAMLQGYKLAVGSTYFAPTLLTTTGVKAYAGGDKIHWDSVDARWEDAAGANVSEVYVDGYFTKTATSASYQNVGDVLDPARTGAVLETPAGFTIGADTDVNTDGEQLIWIAYR